MMVCTRIYEDKKQGWKGVKDALWLPIRKNIKKQQNFKKGNDSVDLWREAGKQNLGEQVKRNEKRK